jgi:hypothetical protein
MPFFCNVRGHLVVTPEYVDTRATRLGSLKPKGLRINGLLLRMEVNRDDLINLELLLPKMRNISGMQITNFKYFVRFLKASSFQVFAPFQSNTEGCLWHRFKSTICKLRRCYPCSSIFFLEKAQFMKNDIKLVVCR